MANVSFLFVHNVCEFSLKALCETKDPMAKKPNKKNHLLNKEIPAESSSNTIINAHQKRKKAKNDRDK